MNRKISVIWDYFTVIESDKAKCGFCKTVLKFNQSSTTNLLRHIKSKHPTTDLSKRSRPNFDVEENNPDDPPSNNGNLSASTSSNSGVVSTSTSNRDRFPLFYRQPSSSIRPQQCQISNYFSKQVTASKRQLIDQQVIKMIVKEYYPFSIVEDVEFIKLVNMLNPGYSLPSRKTLSTSLLPVLYNEIYKKVHSDIEVNAQYVALTTDAWTSLKNESYTAITVHFIDQNCELKSYLLSCAKFPMRHTSENIKDCLQNIVRQWGLQNKIAACTTDNASNITSAIRLCQWRHVSCFAHSLNLIVQSSLDQIKETRVKVKSIVEYFKRSTLATEKLNQMQEQLGYSPVHTLIQDVVTRWNSTFHMFQRFFELKTPILSSLADLNYNVSLTSDDWQIISKSCDILKRFEEITIEMSSEKGVTISKTILFTQALINFCNKLMTQHQTIPCIDSFIHKLTEEMNKRFGQLEKNMLLAEATFLEPRFKKYGFKNHFAFQDTKRSIVNKGKIIINEKNVQQRNLTTYPIPPTASNKEDSIWNDFDLEVTDIVQSQDPKALIARSNDPLKWWNENKNIYPTLFEIMKRRFCIQGTSVPSERVFSKGGQMVTEKRNRLSSKRVDKLFF
ncbi:hypothetical protein AGLY_015832 [Aphis glycines]|uniref:BED-type domain-containing protein n=1 Tax=Aphis glycines TaxID=307491 RepID=A0A6G0SZT8_APHGL|nr:hypothetical protein AGLY_015832 [Aphis glycines]